MSQPLPFLVSPPDPRKSGSPESILAPMKKVPNSDRRLHEHISRALNKIRKPSTADEITELLNRDLDPEDRPFQAKDVAEWLGNAEDTALTLYWSSARPRK
jgi:hypothetical protein